MSSRYLPDLAGTFSDFSVKGFLRKPGNGMTASGTNTYTATPSPALTAYTTWLSLDVLFTNGNTGASTFNVSGLGAKAIQSGGVALTSGQIVAGATYTLVYDGTHFQLLGSPGPQGAAGHGATTASGAPTLSLGVYVFSVADSTAFLVGGYAYVSDGTNSIYSVIATVPDSTHVGLLLGGSTTAGSLAAFTTGTMTFAGKPGAAGATGTDGAGPTTTTAAPTFSAGAWHFAVNSSAAFTAGQTAFCGDGTNSILGTISSVPDSTHVLIAALGDTVTGTVSSITTGSLLTFAGPVGPTGAAGVASVTGTGYVHATSAVIDGAAKTAQNTAIDIGSFAVAGSAFTKPVAANFTASSGVISATDLTNRMQVNTALASNTQCALTSTTNLPATPYTIDLAFSAAFTQISGAAIASGAGIFLSDGTKYIGHALIAFTSGVETFTFTLTTLTATATNIATTFPIGGNQVYLRITDDGTHRAYWISSNGLDYSKVFQENTNTFLTPTKCGIMCRAASASPPIKLAVYNFVVTGSALGDAS